MTNRSLIAGLAAAIAVAATTPAVADPFTLNPNAVKLNGGKVTADMLVLADYAKIEIPLPSSGTAAPFSTFTAPFTDIGILPIVGYTLNGRDVTPQGYGTAGSWGAYISYRGTGTQTFLQLPTGAVPTSAAFEALSYSIVGYNGAAAFGFDSNGSASVTGTISNITTLDTGSLISGGLAFVPNPLDVMHPTIIGSAETTVREVAPQFIQGAPVEFDVNFVHPSGDYTLIPPQSFPPVLTVHIAPGNGVSPLSTATFLDRQAINSGNQSDTVASVTEPASLMLVGVGLFALAAGRRRIAG